MRSLAFMALIVCVVPLAARAQAPDMQPIPAGSFTMGSPRLGATFLKRNGDYRSEDEHPQHPVRLTKPFYLSKTEVTVGQFKRFVSQANYQTTAEKNGLGIVGFDPHESENGRTKYSFRQQPNFTWKNPGFDQTDDHPVVGVSWHDAQEYCKWLSRSVGKTFRLPTEAEWEYACRAAGDTPFSWGDQYVGVIHEKANIGNVELEKACPTRVVEQWLIDIENDPPDPHIFTAPVASYPANAFGLHDMHGNVWEWCEDRYLDTYYQKFKRPSYDKPIPLAIDPLNTEPQNEFGDWRAIRGGSWFVSPIQARAAVRSFFEAEDAACYVGFRVAHDGSAQEIAAARAAFDREQQAWKAVDAAVGGLRSRETELRAEFSGTPAKEVAEHFPDVVGLTDISISARGRLEDPSVLADVAAVPRLRELRLHHTGDGVNDEHFAPFAEADRLEAVSLTVIPNLTDAGLAHFAGNNKLKRLSIDCPQITDDGLRRFAGLPELTTLQILGTSSRGAVLSDFANSPLVAISVGRMTDETAAALSSFRDLEQLTCRGGEFTEDGLSHIAGLKKLTRLELDECRNIAANGFGSLAELRSLTRLSLQGTHAGDEAVGFMSQMQNLGNLEVGSDTLTNKGMRGICDILTLTRLAIEPQATEVTDRGFVDFWRLSRLNFLSIAAPQVTGSGFATLTEIPHLHELRIIGDSLTDAGLLHISEIPELKTLRITNGGTIGPAAVTDQGLLYLAEAKQLRHLELYGKAIHVTDEGIAKLQAAMPGMRIDRR